MTFARALKGRNKKCLVLDCDNTLWGGIIGEDGMAGIRLGETHPGSAYVELHGALLDLYHRGILLALNSKNNHADAVAVFREHPSSALRPNHFVAMRINWQDKAQNIREIAAELNIGLDSIVFLDDSPFECQYVREALPEVTVVQLPEDPTHYASIVRRLTYFDTLAISAEDRRRSDMYHAQVRRAELQRSNLSPEEYLQTLQMTLRIAPVSEFTIPRVAQLTQKTNQFNLTTRRYSEADVRRLAADPAWRLYCAELTDKFDSSGIIAAAFVEDRPGEARIDTFLMSCRVIGRGVEQALIARIAADTKSHGAKSMLAQFVPTPKNGLAATFLERMGFRCISETERRWWAFDVETSVISTPDWLRIPDLATA